MFPHNCMFNIPLWWVQKILMGNSYFNTLKEEDRYITDTAMSNSIHRSYNYDVCEIKLNYVANLQEELPGCRQLKQM